MRRYRSASKIVTSTIRARSGAAEDPTAAERWPTMATRCGQLASGARRISSGCRGLRTVSLGQKYALRARIWIGLSIRRGGRRSRRICADASQTLAIGSDRARNDRLPQSAVRDEGSHSGPRFVPLGRDHCTGKMVSNHSVDFLVLESIQHDVLGIALRPRLLGEREIERSNRRQP